MRLHVESICLAAAVFAVAVDAKAGLGWEKFPGEGSQLADGYYGANQGQQFSVSDSAGSVFAFDLSDDGCFNGTVYQYVSGTTWASWGIKGNKMAAPIDGDGTVLWVIYAGGSGCS